MTEAEWKVAEDYVRVIANMIGLRDWSYSVDREPPREGAEAEIFCLHGRKLAAIRFAWNFRTKPMRDQKETVVHELLHCHTSGMDYTTEMLKDMLHPDAWKMFQQSFTMQMEHCVEGICIPFAALLPDIPWPAEGEGDPAQEDDIIGEVIPAEEIEPLDK